MIKKIVLHLPVLAVSVIAAVLLARSNIFEQLVQASLGGTFTVIIISLIAGILYSSIFTVAPATVALFELGASGVPIPILAIFGGLGGMLADLSLFEIIKFTLIDDIRAHFQRKSQGHFAHLFKIRFFRGLLIVIGALTIATPIPDEVGLAMMGLGKAQWPLVSVLTFVLNAIGIALIGLLARAS